MDSGNPAIWHRLAVAVAADLAPVFAAAASEAVAARAGCEPGSQGGQAPRSRQ